MVDSVNSNIPKALFAECSKCARGAEACQYCENIGMSEDWEVICDCGLYDFGCHLLNACEGREEYKYVIAADYKASLRLLDD